VSSDHRKIEWRYEPEGFALQSGWYLPDFYLPHGTGIDHPRPCWIEVKGAPASRAEKLLAIELSAESERRVFLLEGDIPQARTYGLDSLPGLMAAYFIPEMQCWDHGPFISHPALETALTRARSARFEHGENG
jgi:hypothetical protein